MHRASRGGSAREGLAQRRVRLASDPCLGSLPRSPRLRCTRGSGCPYGLSSVPVGAICPFSGTARSPSVPSGRTHFAPALRYPSGLHIGTNLYRGLEPDAMYLLPARRTRGCCRHEPELIAAVGADGCLVLVRHRASSIPLTDPAEHDTLHGVEERAHLPNPLCYQGLRASS